MKKYTKDNRIKFRSDIVIHKNGKQIINPTEEMLLADGWVEYLMPEPTAEELLAQAKADKVREIETYDTSSAVNEFFYQNVPFWLPRETRVSVRSTAWIMQEAGKAEMTLWLGDVNVTLPIEQILQILSALEIYALECYNQTAMHKATINSLDSVDAVQSYDHTTGYPEKLYL